MAQKCVGLAFAQAMGITACFCLSGPDRYASPYSPFSIALLIIGATLPAFMPLAKQYFDSSHTDSLFWPLLELQPQQQSAIFSRVMMEASLMMCSQLAADLRDTLAGVKATPQ
jgi:hypothetical protein